MTSQENHAVNHEGTQGHAEHGQLQEDIVFFTLVMLLCGAVLREVNKKTGIPYTPLVVVFGMLLEFGKGYTGYLVSPLNIFGKINPHLLLLLFIPVLIFESAYNMDFYVFRKSLINVLLLAVPGVLITAVLLGFVLKSVLGYTDQESITWNAALTMGAIYGATDPVAVVALLKELGAPLRFNVLIEGESLLNDGTAMVFFQVFLDLVKGNSSDPTAIVGNFVRLALCGPLLGVVMGVLTCMWLRRVIRDDVLTSLITVLATYITFYLAEFTQLHVSGILAVVTLGCFMAAVGRTQIYPESEHSLHVMWMFLQYSCETLIFLLTGILIGKEFATDENIVSQDWVNLIVFYIFMLLARLIMVFVFYPMYSHGGYSLSIREVLVLAYGGLRGALGLCLALIVGVDETLPPRFRALTVFYMAGIAILTLVLNGLTAKWIVQKLEIVSVPQIKFQILKNTVREVVSQVKIEQKSLMRDQFLSLAKWKEVEEYTGLNQILDEVSKEEQEKFLQKEKKNAQTIEDPDSPLMQPLSDLRSSMKEYEGYSQQEISVEIRFNTLKLIKGLIWEFYEKGELSANSTYIMDDSIYMSLDNPKNPIKVWSLVIETLENKWLTSTLLPYRETAFIGPVIKNAITNNMTSLYEMSTVYLSIIEHTKHELHNTPLKKDFVQMIDHELNQEVNSAKDYIFNLQAGHPEIMSAIQTKRASSLLLHQLQTQMNEKKEHGYLEEKDYLRVRKFIDRKLIGLENKNIPWTEEHFDKLIIKCPIFACLSQQELKVITSKAERVKFKRGKHLCQKNSSIKQLFIVISGFVDDKISPECTKLCTPSSVISSASVVTKNEKSLTEALAKTDVQVYAFPLEEIAELMKNNHKFWKNMMIQSLFYFIRLKPLRSALHELEDSELLEFVSQIEPETYQQGHQLRLQYGAFVLVGEIQDQDDPQKIYKKFTVIEDVTSKYICNSECSIGIFMKPIPKKHSKGEGNRSQQNSHVEGTRQSMFIEL